MRHDAPSGNVGLGNRTRLGIRIDLGENVFGLRGHAQFLALLLLDGLLTEKLIFLPFGASAAMPG
jgi:hypothetical protein